MDANSASHAPRWLTRLVAFVAIISYGVFLVSSPSQLARLLKMSKEGTGHHHNGTFSSALWRRGEPVKVYAPSTSNATAAICLIVRNETIYLDEWADFHISLGFAPIIVYDNADAPDLELQSWLERRKDIQHLVHITHMPITPVQVYAYERCLRQDAVNNTFAAPIDIDEFVVLKKHDNILDFLADHCDEDCGQVSINWRTMGTSNEESYRPLPVTKRNVNVHTFEPLRRVIKVILRPTYIDDNIDWSHSVNLKRGHWIDTSGNRIERTLSYGPTKGRPPYEYAGPTDVAELYHYRFKSEEEFRDKNCVRGDSLQKRGDNPKCTNLNKPQNYPRTGGEFDDSAWKQLKRMCPKYGLFDEAESVSLY